jgi:hypothetical protein
MRLPTLAMATIPPRSPIPLACHRDTRFPLVCHRIRFTAVEVNPFHRSRPNGDIFSPSTPATSSPPLEASLTPCRRRCVPPPAPPQSARHLLSFDSAAPQPRPPPPSPARRRPSPTTSSSTSPPAATSPKDGVEGGLRRHR